MMETAAGTENPVKMQSGTSPFLTTRATTEAGELAVLHLRRDSLLPTILQAGQAPETGYAEGAVTTTRFGSYPHSTLISTPWGSQIRASNVDTGSRGRPGKRRKLQHPNNKTTETDDRQQSASPLKQADPAASGFCHLLPPTPEAWTMSLPHRTQVVYTPDYSFILQKLRIRPGDIVIEAGAGSGSFTHASARAVFDGYPNAAVNGTTTETLESNDNEPAEFRYSAIRGKPTGRVYSFEYHEPRANQLKEEIRSHGLGEIVHITHRDVYNDGFLLPSSKSSISARSPPQATHVFLDLPAPWLALPHLTRKEPSPLNPQRPIHLSIFLPCIEQVQQAVAALRSHGWLEISMYNLAHRRLEVRREHVGVNLEGLRGVNATAKDVSEALKRLLEVQQAGKAYREIAAKSQRRTKDEQQAEAADDSKDADKPMANAANGDGHAPRTQPHESKAQRLARIAEEAAKRKPWREGRLVHRTEPELKTHTSYLVFAVLPRAWTEEDERRCAARWGSGAELKE